MARILIAGYGRLGAALGRLLVGSGHEVFGLCRSPAAAPDPVSRLRGDLAREDGIPALPGGLDAICYTAAADAGDEDAYRRAYVNGPANLTRALLAQGQRPSRVLFVSSTAVYGQKHGEWVDEDSPTAPSSFRGRVLLEGERCVRGGPFPAVVARLAGIYGPGRTFLLDAVRSGRASAVAEDPPVYTNRIHEADCAGMLAHLLRLESPQPVYLGVDDEPAPRSEVVSWLAARLGIELSGATPPMPSGRRDGNKRCRNTRLVESGYRLRYPTYRDGYGAMLA